MRTKLTTNKLVMGLATLLGTAMAVPNARADEPQAGVARISMIHGDVSTQRGDSGEWGAATINTPVVAGDHISTGTRSRAEVQLDYANILRLDERANVKIADLSRTRTQIQVGEGLINYTVLKGSEADVEIDTANVAIHPLAGEGSYRILVIDDQTRVIVRRGELEVTTPQGSTQVRKDQEIDIRGRDNPEFQVIDAPRHDEWDNWNKERDHRIQDAESWHHTNRYYSGTEDLDHSGRWVYVPGYGDVWQPAVSADWAPYRDGRWVWEPYYGWTWVSYEPWGWAPYHYGRWFYYGDAWSWWPGPIYPAYYPVWAPAYVSFFGFGRHFGFGFGFGFGSVGWLPIGPSDCFFPWWGGGRRDVNIVNVTNITNITNITNVHPAAPLGTGRPTISNLNGVTTNAHLQRGITAMPTEKFGHSAVAHNTVAVSAAEIRQGGMVTGDLPVTPTKESFHATDRPVNSSSLPKQTGRPEHFFTKAQSTAIPQPSHGQAAQVAQGPRQQQTATQTPRGTGATQPAPGLSADRQNWHRFGAATTAVGDHAAPQPRTQAPMQSAAAPQPNAQAERPAVNSSGWQKFSGPPQPSATQPREPQQPQQYSRPAASTPAPTARPATPPQSGGWQHFTPQQDTRPSSTGRPPIMERGQSRNWQSSSNSSASTYRPAPQTDYRPEPQTSYRPAPRTDYRPAPQTSYRPALDLHRPIVTPRSSSSYGGSHGESRGGGYGGSSRGSSSAGGRSSAPSGGSRESSGGGGSSHPHGSGSHGRG